MIPRRHSSCWVNRETKALMARAGIGQLAEESPCGGGVSSTLDQDIEDITILVNGTPQVMPVASDGDEDLVKEPSAYSEWPDSINGG